MWNRENTFVIMTLNDLKNFDIVTTRDTRQLFVYNDIFINIYDSTCVLLKSNYNGNMQHNTWNCNDIMKVERMDDETSVRNIDRFMFNYLKRNGDVVYKTIYQRIEITELTMQQIADKFGVPVESLKIKK